MYYRHDRICLKWYGKISMILKYIEYTRIIFLIHYISFGKSFHISPCNLNVFE